MLQGIKLGDQAKESFNGTRYFDILENVRQINTFVGVNNSGKSRFLRTLFSGGDSIRYIYELEYAVLSEMKRHLDSIFKLIGNLEANNIMYRFRPNINFLNKNYQDKKDDSLKYILDLYLFFSSLDEDDFEMVNLSQRNILMAILRRIRPLVTDLGNQIDKLGESSDQIKKIYIPILRGLRPIAVEAEDFSSTNLYLERTKFDYFPMQISNGKIFTGLSIYEDIKRLLLGNESERDEIIQFEIFLAENVFKKKINLIPKYDDDVLHIKIGTDPQFPIYKLGDGLQTLMIILFPIFINRKEKHLIFIEEPETHLHPKWQRLLSRSFSGFANHAFFISTHSSVFINSGNSSIFIVSKKSDKTNIHYSDIKTKKVEILKELGYKPNDLYQTNYLVWVEGQSDKVYFNYMLKKLDESLVEGEDYSIMFYGGSSYKHFLMNKGELNLDFIESLNQNYGIVMDSDRTKLHERYNLKKKEIVSLFEKNKAYCWLTKLREVENYIPFAVFEASVKKVHKIKAINIDSGDFADRCKVEDLDSKTKYRPSIKLSNEMFSKIQKNGNGTLKGIRAKELKDEIERAVQKTSKNYFGIDKIKVAEECVNIGFEIENDELSKKMMKLVEEIRKANR